MPADLEDRADDVERVGRADHHRFQVGGVQRVEHLVGDARVGRRRCTGGRARRGRSPASLKYSWNGTAPSSVSTCVRTGSSLIGRTRACTPSSRQKSSVISVRRRSLRQALRAQQRGGERLVAERRALRPAELFQHGLRGARLVLGLPAGGRAGDAGERVEHGVEVGREVQPEVLVVVAGVDDHARGPCRAGDTARRRASRRRPARRVRPRFP